MAFLRLRNLYDPSAAVRPLGSTFAFEGTASAGALHRQSARHAQHPRPALGVKRILWRTLFHRRHDDVLGRTSSRREGHRTWGLSQSETLARCDRDPSCHPARMGTVSDVMPLRAV